MADLRHRLDARSVDGFEAVVMGSSGGLEATFLPGAGMVCCSLRHHGEELLGQRGGIEHYVREHGTMGIPLLYPWANRLTEWRFALGGREVDLGRAEQLVSRDPNGLPIHGLMAGHPGWLVERQEADSQRALLCASFDFEAGELIAAFPFPHRLAMEVELCEGVLRIGTTVRATGDQAVPVSFGFHPYFTLPGVRREQWEVYLPVSEHLVVDERLIPTGEREPAHGVEPGPLGDRTFDDGYSAVAPDACFSLAGGGRRVEVRFETGYPVAVVYAPSNDAVICFEPMTAPTNALCSGDGLRWVKAGEEFTARFSVTVQDDPAARKN